MDSAQPSLKTDSHTLVNFMAQDAAASPQKKRPVLEDDPRNMVTTTIDHINRMVQIGNEMLEELIAKIQDATHDQASQWKERIKATKAKSIKPRKYIGVIGATGAGKSSLINALLDEKSVVPTSCMQACTATVTEIAWNESDEQPYRAEIEFVSADEWRQELEALYSDVVDPDGKLSKDLKDDGSEAGIAFMKMCAVYPFLDGDDRFKTSVDELMDQEYLTSLLGNKILIAEDTATALHSGLKNYIEGKEKLRSIVEKHETSASPMLDKIEYWPLIRKVRIFLRTRVLETGCVIVDLPGVADSNAARGSIAQRYLTNCASLWVVAPIVRAVDDKVARQLLGEGLKRQLRRDGVLNRITFVCSKADEIVISELRNRLLANKKLAADITAIDERKAILSFEKDTLAKEMSVTTQKHNEVSSDFKALQQECSHYYQLSLMAKSGKQVHPPVQQRSKRTLEEETAGPNKQPKIQEYMWSQPFSTRAYSPMSTVQGISKPATSNTDTKVAKQDVERAPEQDVTQPALTIADINRKLKELRLSRHKIRDEKDKLKAARQDQKRRMTLLQEQENDLADREFATYVEGRNAYCSEAIREDFVAGIHDMEKDDAQEDDDEFNPEPDDEEPGPESQQDLPVFCTSSQAFHKLRGRLEGEKIFNKFKTLDQTGIPALAIHCWKFGAEENLAYREAYTEGIRSLLTSVRCWLSGGQIDDEDVPEGSYTICDATNEMVQDINTMVQGSLKTIDSLLHSGIIDKFPDAATAGENAALDIVVQWGNSPANDTPGYRYQTYKAVVRRNGVFTKVSQEINFADDLMKPVFQVIDGPWQRIFNEAIPKKLNDAARKCQERIDQYQADLKNRPEFLAASSTAVIMYRHQLASLKKTLLQLFRDARKIIEEQQRLVNRLFLEGVRAEMIPIYSELAADRGPGVFARMKGKMKKHVDEVKGRIFDEANTQVKTALTKMIEKVTNACSEDVDKYMGHIVRDCNNLFIRKTRGTNEVSLSARIAIEEYVRHIEHALDAGLVDDLVLHKVETTDDLSMGTQIPPDTIPDPEVAPEDHCQTSLPLHSSVLPGQSDAYGDQALELEYTAAISDMEGDGYSDRTGDDDAMQSLSSAADFEPLEEI